MAKNIHKLAEEFRDPPDVEKLRLLDAVLTDVEKPDPEIDRIWAEEARKRWAAYKADKVRPFPMNSSEKKGSEVADSSASG